MKQSIKSILSILVAITMVFAFVGCDKKNTNSSGTGVDSANDDFFVDTETNQGKNNSGEGSSSGTGSKASSGTGNSQASATKENKVGGKSWKEVLNSMPKNLRGSELKVYNWNPPSEYTGAPTVIEEFEKQTGIKVKWNTVNYDVYVTRLASLVAADEAPDLVRTRTPVPSRLVNFQPLSSTGYDFSDEAWDQVLMSDYTVNGTCYATSLKNTHLGSVEMMFYNKELINRYNYEDPYTLWKNGKWTMNKFIEMCRAYMKDADNAQFACTGAFYQTWTQLYGIAGPIGYDGKKYYSNAKNSTFLTVVQEVADLYSDKLYMYGCAEVFDKGNSLFYAGASVYARRKNSYFGSLKQSGTFYAVPMPSVDGQSVYYQARDEYEAYAIADGAKNAKAAPYFLRYFLDGSNYELSNFFCNKQNLEVYNWCMNQKNTIWTTGFTLTDSNFGNYNSTDSIYQKTRNQIKSYVDSNSAAIDKTVAGYNDTLKKLIK